MKRILILLFSVVFLSACSSQPIKTPCPDFGAHCHKKPINVWNYYDA